MARKKKETNPWLRAMEVKKKVYMQQPLEMVELTDTELYVLKAIHETENCRFADVLEAVRESSFLSPRISVTSVEFAVNNLLAKRMLYAWGITSVPRWSISMIRFPVGDQRKRIRATKNGVYNLELRNLMDINKDIEITDDEAKVLYTMHVINSVKFNMSIGRNTIVRMYRVLFGSEIEKIFLHRMLLELSNKRLVGYSAQKFNANTVVRITNFGTYNISKYKLDLNKVELSEEEPSEREVD